jgi:hypothetical protein
MRAEAMFDSKLRDDDALLAEVRAAELLCLSTRTLQAWRMKGEGPAYVRAGRAIRYRRRDLIAWVNENTCQPGEATPAKVIHASPPA